jgi:hypothetical protein
VIGTPQLDDLPHLDENTAQLLSNLPTRSPQVRNYTYTSSVVRLVQLWYVCGLC